MRTLVAMATYSSHRLIIGKVEIDNTGRMRTLVAIATYSSHRLIMGKVEIDNFCQVIGDI